MAIKEEQTRDGKKLRDTDTGKLVGSVATNGKDNIPTVAPVLSQAFSNEENAEDRIALAGEKFNKVKENAESGDRETALANEFYRVVTGSQLNGMHLENSDRDEMGIYFENPGQLIGLSPSEEQYSIRSVAQGERSKPGDTDLTVYSLRKYMGLALQGNPSILAPLFAPEDLVLKSSPFSSQLVELSPKIISARAGWRHLGYLEGQRERMTGGGQQRRVPNRPELIDQYGYDVKYASHALRLGLQGIELMTTGRLFLPMTPENLERTMKVKLGKVSFEEALRDVDDIKAQLKSIMESKGYNVPEKPDYKSVNKWVVDATLTHWKKNNIL